MPDVSTTSLRLSSAAKARLKIMALAQGVSQSELAEELIDREHALRHGGIIQPWVAISGLDGEVDIPQANPKFEEDEKPQRILDAEKALQVQLESVRDAEDAWAAASTPEGALDFVEALKRGDIYVVDGKIAVPKKGRTTKVFPMVDLERRTWLYDLSRRTHLKSLSLPQDIIDSCGIEDQTDGCFTITDDESGKIVALRERLRISSGCELQILAKFRPKIAKLKRLRIEYHGQMDE